jgi:flagellin-like protein
MNLEKIQRKGISPIIATLLLILIAIAAGVIVYAYVVGFIGNSTTNPGGATSVLQITNFCASTNAGDHCNGNIYSISILNTGSTTLTNAVFQVYFNDITSPTAGSGSTSCTLTLAPGATGVCPTSSVTSWTGILGATANAGDTLTVKVVAPDGGSATSTTKAI